MSAAIRTFSYDESRTELTVTFATGKAYVYSLIPAPLAAAFAAAPSKGAFHNRFIRDRYPQRKIASLVAGDRRLLIEALRASQRD